MNKIWLAPAKRGAVMTWAVPLMLLVVSPMLAGCGGRSMSNIPAATEAFNVQPDPLFPETQNHRLGPSDLIHVTVYRAPEVSGEYRVDGAGNIMMPLVGVRSVLGMTPLELAAALNKDLSKTYYVDPDVSVTVKEAASQRFTIDGSVGAPGQYAVTGRTTLMQAMAMAKGASGAANLRRIVVFRQIEGQRMAAAFDLHQIRQGKMQDPLIYASDIIIVDGSRTRQALRDVISTLPIVALFRPFIY
jgi:polysaccharide biosynthesis/export protein